MLIIRKYVDKHKTHKSMILPVHNLILRLLYAFNMNSAVISDIILPP